MKVIDLRQYLSIQILGYLGNDNPKKEHIHIISSLLGPEKVLDSISNNSVLTLKEKACLLLAAHGKSTSEISEILKMPIGTVACYRDKVISKLKVRNMAQAIYYLASKNINQ